MFNLGKIKQAPMRRVIRRANHANGNSALNLMLAIGGSYATAAVGAMIGEYKTPKARGTTARGTTARREANRDAAKSRARNRH